VGVAGVAVEALLEPRLEPVERPLTPWPAVGLPPLQRQPAFHRVPTATELPGDPLRPPAEPPQPPHRLHVLGRLHLSPRASRSQGTALCGPSLHRSPPLGGGQFSCRQGVSFRCRPISSRRRTGSTTESGPDRSTSSSMRHTPRCPSLRPTTGSRPSGASRPPSATTASGSTETAHGSWCTAAGSTARSR